MHWKGSDHSWSRASILMNVPNLSGVYVMWNTHGCICIGETHDLQRRLLDHHDSPTSCMTEFGPPTAFGYELCSVLTRSRRKSELIHSLRVQCAEVTC
jgi:hypothetical protein